MTAPDFMPMLSRGSHGVPSEGACVMEYCSILAGERFTDHPECTHPVLAEAARCVNDRLGDETRHLLVPLIGRLTGTADTREDETDRKVLSVRLVVWAARFALQWVRDEDRAACEEAVDAAERWAAEPSKENRSAAASAAYAAYAAYAAAYAAYAAAASAASAANAAAYAAAYAAYAAAASAASAANAGGAAATELVEFLTGLLDEHQRLTDHTPRDVSEDELWMLTAATA